MNDNKYLYPKEPSRFELKHLDPLLIYAHQLGASDITFQTACAIKAEIQGLICTLTRRELSNAEVGDLLNAIYGPNGTVQLMRGEDLDTHYEIRPNRNERFRYRVNGTACHIDGHEGIQITIRTIPSEPPDVSELDLPPAILEAITPQEGVVYITGSTGSGKTTLLAAVIKMLAENPDSHRKILTYESPIEYVYDRLHTPTAIISQSEIPRHLPSFAAGVRNALRRKPHLILVGEARDNQTIQAVLEAALTGHPVYTTLHSNGVAETIRRLVSSFSAEERSGRTIDIIETMRLVIWQRLVPATNGQRVALREFLVFDEKIRDQLLAGDPNQITAITRTLLQTRGQLMQQDVEQKYQAGLITERTYKILSAQSKYQTQTL